jgi:hypothetical protein
VTREEIIAICDRAVVQHDKWSDRDSYSAQEQVAMLRALMLAGCDFEMDTHMSHNDGIVWVRVACRTFTAFEYGEMGSETFYIPTIARLEDTAGEDWYC